MPYLFVFYPEDCVFRALGFFVRKISPVSLEKKNLTVFIIKNVFLGIHVPYGVWPGYIVICIQMMKPGSSFFLKMAEMDLKAGTSTMETLVRTSVSII